MAHPNRKAKISPSASSPLLNRSSTINYSSPHHHQNSSKYPPSKIPTLDRSATTTTKKWYDTVGAATAAGSSIKGKVRQLRDLFEPTRIPKPSFSTSSPLNKTRQPTTKQQQQQPSSPEPNTPTIRLPGTEDRVVVFYTSLRGIRRTFQDCYAVRMILKGYRIHVDERDVSMDISYRKELQSVMGEKAGVSLPQVFVRGRHLGGSDIVKQLNEIGELRKVLAGFPRESGSLCDACGDVRFLPCSNCDGSRKVYDEDEDVMKRCPICNENGLVRCPICLLCRSM